VPQTVGARSAGKEWEWLCKNQRVCVYKPQEVVSQTLVTPASSCMFVLGLKIMAMFFLKTTISQMGLIKRLSIHPYRKNV